MDQHRLFPMQGQRLSLWLGAGKHAVVSFRFGNIYIIIYIYIYIYLYIFNYGLIKNEPLVASAIVRVMLTIRFGK